MKNNGLETRVLEMMPQIFPNAIDMDMAKHVQEYLEEKGIKVFPNCKVKKISGKEK